MFKSNHSSRASSGVQTPKETKKLSILLKKTKPNIDLLPALPKSKFLVSPSQQNSVAAGGSLGFLTSFDNNDTSDASILKKPFLSSPLQLSTVSNFSHHRKALSLQSFASEEIRQIYDKLEKDINLVSSLDHHPFDSNQQYQPRKESLDIDTFQITVHEPTEALTHIELFPNIPHKMEIVRFKFYYFKAKIHGKEGPLQIFFKRRDQDALPKFKIYLSTKGIYPNKFNSEYIFSGKFFQLYPAERSLIFTDMNLYIAIYSDQEFVLAILLMFGSFKPKICPKDDSIIIHEDKSPTAFEYRIQEERQDKIIENMQMERFKLRNINRLRDLKSEELEKQLIQASIRKKQVDQQKQLQILSKIQANEMLRDYKRYREYQAMKKVKQGGVQFTWLKLILVTNTIAEIHSLIQRDRYMKKVMARGRVIVMKFYIDKLVKVRQTGFTHNQRTVFKTRLSLRCIANHIKAAAKKNAGNIITEYLKKTQLPLTILAIHKNLVAKIITIQQKFRYLRKMKKYQRERIWKLIYKQFAPVMHELKNLRSIQMGLPTDQSHQKKQQFSLDTGVMSIIIEEFCERQRVVWNQYFHSNYILKDEKKKSKTLEDLAHKFKAPKLYDIPNQNELTNIIMLYAQVKKLL